MSSPSDDPETRTVLRCVQRRPGIAAAFFLPFVPERRSMWEGEAPRDPAELLSPEDCGRLRASERLNDEDRDPPRTVVPVLDRAGRAFGALGALHTEAGEADTELTESLFELGGLLGHALAADVERPEETEFSRFFSLILDNLCIAGFDGYFKLLNPSWEKTTGYSLAELYSKPYVEFVHPDDRDVTIAEKDWLSQGGKTFTFSNRYVRKDGSLCYLQWMAAPAPERERVYAVARDVTGQILVSEELRRSREVSEAASQAKSAFLAMMSHELRTPLNSVIGFSDLLLRNVEGNLSPDEVKYAERIRANGRNLLELINSILDLSRIEAGRVEPDITEVDLTELARDIVASLAPARRPGVELLLETPPGPILYATDEGRLRQILVNLAGNGLKFTSAGSVTLRLTASDGRPVAFEVEDTGPGMENDALHTIFEPFKQLEEGATRRHGGTGLGLAISRSFADALGLRIQVQSTLGRGTTFRLALTEEDA